MGCSTGGRAALDTFDMLTSSVNWVEQGKAPESVTATGKALPEEAVLYARILHTRSTRGRAVWRMRRILSAGSNGHLNGFHCNLRLELFFPRPL